MINLTLTITAAPELLAVMTGFTSAITAAKVNLIPEYNSEFIDHKALREQTAAYNGQNPSVHQGVGAQQAEQTKAPAGVTKMYIEPNTVQVNQMNNAGAADPTYGVQPMLQAPVQTAPTQVNSVPTSAQSYTMEQLAVAATQLVDAGRREELVNLLKSFGVQALTALSKEQYGAFATQLRTLGAKI
jgi:hypothetical protein